jgi:5-methylcytosine-specific restriction endonuclease McrA
MRPVTRISAYYWYLASPHWKVRRRAALKRANYLCQNCGQRATQVHHLTYVGVFKESPSDLVALCDRCHADLHHKTPANDNQLTMFPLLAQDKN